VLGQECIPGDDHAAIVGDGKLALLVAEVAGREVQRKRHEGPFGSDAGAVLFGRHGSKMELLTQGSSTHAVYVSHASSCQQSFSTVVDVSGRPSGFETARCLVKPTSTLIPKSACADKVPVNTSGIVVQEIDVRGSRCGWFNLAIDLLEHELDLTHHISAEYLLDRT